MQNVIRKSALALSLSAAMVLPATAMAAEGHKLDSFSSVVDQAKEYGFTHFVEIQTADRSSIDVEGWVGENREAEVRFSLDGQVLEEDVEQDDEAAYGLTAEQLSDVIDALKNADIVSLDSIDLEERYVEAEGYGSDGKDYDIKLDRNTFEVVRKSEDMW